MAEKLACTVGGRRLFRDLDLVVKAGDLVEIRGSNGSGKSTLLRCLAGLLEPQAGRVERRVDMDYLGHKLGVSARMTPLENVRWLVGLRTETAAAAALDAALSRLGVGAARHDLCGTLSAGQQRRAALARLLVCQTELWLLDEPLTALDDAGSTLVRELVADHRADGGAVVCATHRALSSPAGGSASSSLPATRIVTLGP